MKKSHKQCIETVIAPLCKNENSGINDTGNCKPVSHATVIYKLIEHCILLCISPFATTTNLSA